MNRTERKLKELFSCDIPAFEPDFSKIKNRLQPLRPTQRYATGYDRPQKAPPPLRPTFIKQWTAAAAVVVLCATIVGGIVIPTFADPPTYPNPTSDIPTTTARLTTSTRRSSLTTTSTNTTSAGDRTPTEVEVQTLIQAYLDYKTLYNSSLEKLLLELEVCTEQELNIYHEQPHNFPLDGSYRAYTNALWQVVNLDSMEDEFLAENESDGEKNCLTPVREEQPEVWRQSSLPVFLSENDDIRLYRVLVTTEGDTEQWYQCRLVPIYGRYRIDSFTAVEE